MKRSGASPPGDPEIERVRAVLEARFGLGGVEPTARIGEYVVLDRIGAGRTGVVHRAYHRASDRTVAIKIVHVEVDSLELRERLRARARLVVPEGIVPVTEVGVDLSTYVVMPHAPGRTLRRWCGDTPRSWREIVGAYARAARVLADAHDLGLAHGDVKPEHVMIDDAGRVAIVDFAGEGDASADQLALCSVLFEALVGDAGAAEHGDRAVELPSALHRVIARGLATDPRARWDSMRALAMALDRG